MLTLEQRPQTFADMAGQDLVKKSLMHIVKDPKNAPKTLLLCGQFGTGKTTSARIFARALNCPNKTPQGDACGRADCPICGHDIQDSIFYDEYDSAIVGNVNAIKDLRNTFYFGYTQGYKVIVLDEVHLVNKTAQGALLKVFEEPEPNVFFLLCTTDPEKLLPTIVSRSFELRFDVVEKEQIISHLEKVLESKPIPELSPEVIKANLEQIADRSHGHMRNAMMLLDSMYLLKEDFSEVIKDSTPWFISLFKASIYYQQMIKTHGQDKVDEAIKNYIKQLSSFPISHLKQDYEKLVLEITKYTFEPKLNTNMDLVMITKPFQLKFNLIDVLNDNTIIELFKNDTQFKIAMIVLSNKLKQLKVG